jgi:hypothetical protein
MLGLFGGDRRRVHRFVRQTFQTEGALLVPVCLPLKLRFFGNGVVYQFCE